MNTLQDLRDTLDNHAATVHDDVAHARSAAVQGRARAVRRRRNVAVAGAAAAAVAAVAVVTVLPGDRDLRPADREVLGQQAPESLDSLGWTYRFDDAAEAPGASRVSLRLQDADGPRLISWATAGEDQVVEVRTGNGERQSSDAADFGDFIWLPADYSGTVTIRADQPGVGVASYEVDASEPPAGTGEGLTTFREDVAGGRLLDASFAEPGAAEATVTFTVPEGGEVSFADFCHGSTPDGATRHLGIVGNDGDLSWGAGCEDSGFDPAGRGFTTTRVGRPGEQVTARIWITEGQNGPLVQAPDLRLGIAAYEPATPVAHLAGWDVPELREYQGHLWRFDSVRRGAPGQRSLTVGYGGPGRRLAVGAFRRAGRASIRFDGDDPGVSLMATGNGAGEIEVLDPVGDEEDEAGLRVRHGPAPADLELGIALFEAAD